MASSAGLEVTIVVYFLLVEEVANIFNQSQCVVQPNKNNELEFLFIVDMFCISPFHSRSVINIAKIIHPVQF